MRSLIVPAVAATVFACASTAYAADATGTIKSIDAVKDTILLNDGSMYTVPSSVKIATFKVGEKVTVTYQKENGKMEASKIAPST